MTYLEPGSRTFLLVLLLQLCVVLSLTPAAISFRMQLICCASVAAFVAADRLMPLFAKKLLECGEHSWRRVLTAAAATVAAAAGAAAMVAIHVAAILSAAAAAPSAVSLLSAALGSVIIIDAARGFTAVAAASLDLVCRVDAVHTLPLLRFPCFLFIEFIACEFREHK